MWCRNGMMALKEGKYFIGNALFELNKIAY